MPYLPQKTFVVFNARVSFFISFWRKAPNWWQAVTSCQSTFTKNEIRISASQKKFWKSKHSVEPRLKKPPQADWVPHSLFLLKYATLYLVKKGMSNSFAWLKEHRGVWTDYKEYHEIVKWVMDLSVTQMMLPREESKRIA